MTAGVHFERTEAYAPVPSWTTIKLQLALTAKHRLGLRAFDCSGVLMQVMSGNFARPFMDMPEVDGSGGTKSQRG
jgi:hypothetical protein